MKHLFLTLFFLFSCFSVGFSQNELGLKVGGGRVLAGNGDLVGNLLMAGIHKRQANWIGFDVLASGTFIDNVRDYGHGFYIREKSNGLSLEGVVNVYLNVGRFSLYPSIGPVVRWAHERSVRELSIWSGPSGIVDVDSEILDENQLQFGYIWAVNLDGRISENLAVGLRGSFQDFHNGQTLAFLGVTLKSVNWPFK